MEESNEAAGVISTSLVGDSPLSFISGRDESNSGSTDSRTIAGGSSAAAKSGSVTHGALCKGVEDSRCSLLPCVTVSLPSVIMLPVDEDETEWPLGSLGPATQECISINCIPPVKSIAEEAVESMMMLGAS